MITLTLPLLLATASPSATTGTGDCIRFDTAPAGATVAIERGVRRSATAPAVFCDLRTGQSWRLSVSLPGWETRRARVRLGADGRLRVAGRRLALAARSLVLPGWGLAAAGERAAATLAFASTAAAGLDAVAAVADWRTERERRDAAAARLAASTVDDPALRDEVSRRTLEADAYRDRAIGALALAGWWHLGGIVTAGYRGSPPRVTPLEGGGYRLAVPRRSGRRAAVLSALWPGAGQFYGGHPERGALIQSAFVAAGMGAMDAWLRFRLRDIASDAAIAALDETGDPQADAIARARARRLWDDRQRMRRRTIAWTSAAAVVWLVGVIDAALSQKGGETPARFGVETSWRGGTLYQGIRVSLP